MRDLHRVGAKGICIFVEVNGVQFPLGGAYEITGFWFRLLHWLEGSPFLVWGDLDLDLLYGFLVIGYCYYDFACYYSNPYLYS